MSVRFQWCAPCERAGHRCPAATMRAREVGRREEPVCLDCIEERVCSAVRVAGQAREESGVRAERVYDYCGVLEVVFPGVAAEVVHRTPEELGIARVVAGNVEERRHERRAQEMERERIQAADREEPRREAGRVASNGNEPKRIAPRPSTQRSKVMQTQTGGRANNRVPAKRYGRPTVTAVAMDDVPEPSHRNAGIAAPLYLQIAELRQGALKVDFETEGHASYVLTKLRKIAKREGAQLLSSKSADGKTRWFWLERAS